LLLIFLNNREKLPQNWPNGNGDIAVFFLFSRWQISAILHFQTFKCLVPGSQLASTHANTHYRSKFHQNGSMIAEISHLAFFKMAGVCCGGFFKF